MVAVRGPNGSGRNGRGFSRRGGGCRPSDRDLDCLFSLNHHRMGLLTIIRKNRFKEKEMRILFLSVQPAP